MSIACLSCGNVNAGKSKFCGKCGKPLSPAKTSSPTARRAGPRAAATRLCKKCNKPRRVTGGPFVDWFTPDGPIDQYWEEREFYVLECNHKCFTRKTGRTKPWEP